MTTLVNFPDWMPWWAQLTLLIGAILLGLAFAAMPFSVFGLKSRLETLEDRLDDIQTDIRRLTLRLPEPGGPDPYEAPAMTRVRNTQDFAPVRAAAPEWEAPPPARDRPPIPPAAVQPTRNDALRPEALRPDLGRGEALRAEPPLRSPASARDVPRGRAEPRLR